MQLIIYQFIFPIADVLLTLLWVLEVTSFDYLVFHTE